MFRGVVLGEFTAFFKSENTITFYSTVSSRSGWWEERKSGNGCPSMTEGKTRRKGNGDNFISIRSDSLTIIAGELF